MDWSEEEIEGSAVIRIKEPFTVSKLNPLKVLLVERLNGAKPIILNLAEIQTCDTAGIQFLVAAAKTAKLMGRSLQYADVPPSILAAAEKIGLNFFEQKEEASRVG